MGRGPPAPRRQLGRFLGVWRGGGPPGWEWGTAREGPATQVSVATAGQRHCGRGWPTRYLPLLNYVTGRQDARSPTFHCPLRQANQRADPAQTQRVPQSRPRSLGRAWCVRVTFGVAPKPPTRIFSQRHCFPGGCYPVAVGRGGSQFGARNVGSTFVSFAKTFFKEETWEQLLSFHFQTTLTVCTCDFSP